MPEEKVSRFSEPPQYGEGYCLNATHLDGHQALPACVDWRQGKRPPRQCGKFMTRVNNSWDMLCNAASGHEPPCSFTMPISMPPVPQEAAPRPPSVEWSRNHLAHVQHFLIEMYQTMVDPCDEFKGNIAELCELLLKMARDQREREHERMTKADLLTNSIRFSEQATAPDWAMRVAANVSKAIAKKIRTETGQYWPDDYFTDTVAALIRQAGSERERDK